MHGNEVLPSVEKRKNDRPQEIRIASQGEEKLHRKCGRCGSRGHNRLICIAPIPLSNNEPVVEPNKTETSAHTTINLTYLSFLLF